MYAVEWLTYIMGLYILYTSFCYFPCFPVCLNVLLFPATVQETLHTAALPDPSASRAQLTLQQLLGATYSKLNVILLNLYLYEKHTLPVEEREPIRVYKIKRSLSMLNHKLQLWKWICTDKIRIRKIQLRQIWSFYTSKCKRILLLGTSQNQLPRLEWMVFI